MRQELEGRLLFAAPAEVLLGGHTTPETRRLAEHIGGQLGAAPRLEDAPSHKHATGDAALAALEAFFSSGAAPASAAAAAASAAAVGGEEEEAPPSAALVAVRALPDLVLRALAHLMDHLRPFGVADVMRLGGASFQEWSAAQEMRLGANTLR